MRKRSSVWLTAAIAAASMCAAPQPSVAQSGALPERLGGGNLPAAALESDAIVVFFATWSPRCRDVVERVNAIDRAWGARVPVMLVAFQEGADEVREFLAARNARIGVFLDRQGTFAKKHAITTLPGLLVVRSGQVAFRGRLPADFDAVLAPIFD